MPRRRPTRRTSSTSPPPPSPTAGESRPPSASSQGGGPSPSPRGSGGFPPPSKPRPVEGGLKARKQRGAIGETWWSQRFIAVLESFGMGPRLDRGRRYARRGQVVSMEVASGKVTALVQGSRVRPYRVLIGVEELSAQDWRQAEEAMAAQALFLAKLLAGEMPDEIEDAFAACDLSLFPASIDDLDTACSCPDWANPCKHVAAVYYLLAEAFDSDPFLIFAWRGRSKEQLLEDLRGMRGAAGSAAAAAPEADADWPEVEVPPLAECLDGFWEPAGSLDEFRLRPRAAAVPDALLRQLDAPNVTVRGRRLEEVLAPAYAVIVSAAERRAMEAGGRHGGGEKS